MSEAVSTTSVAAPTQRRPVEPLPDNLRSVQPGSGFCYQVELAWGRLRRGYLKRIWPVYVQRMAQRRHGSADGAPHEIIDPRDLKYCRPQVTCDWPAEEDRFQWRGKLGFARWGLAEMQIMGWPLVLATFFMAAMLPGWWKVAAVAPGVLLVLVLWFFRDPYRRVPSEPGLVVSPADGKIVEISELPHDDFVGGPAVRIGIFLSIFNVHINRAPLRGRVIKLHYSPGEFLNAMNPESALRNENLWIGLEEDAPPYRGIAVRQIAGLIARRIVCDLRPGEVVERGHKFGMIKLGSRTEIVLPAADLQIDIKIGDKVKGGSTVLARYRQHQSSSA